MVSSRRLPLWLVAAAVAITVAVTPVAATGERSANGAGVASSHRIDAGTPPAATRLAVRTTPDERHDRVRQLLPLWRRAAAALTVVLLALAWAGTPCGPWRLAFTRWVHPARGPPSPLLLP